LHKLSSFVQEFTISVPPASSYYGKHGFSEMFLEFSGMAFHLDIIIENMLLNF
jgi:hypothetical protein